MDLPLPASWNANGLTRRERSILELAKVDDKAVRRRQRRFAAAGLWLLVAAFVVAGFADFLGWAIEAWSPLLAVPGIVLLLRAWELRHVRTTRRVLRRLCGQDPE